MDLPHEAHAYAEADFRDVNARYVQRVLEVAGDRKAARLLDLGCGPGDIPVALAQLRPAWSLVAVDGAEAMLQIARQRARTARATNLRFVRDDAKTLGMLEGTFDVISSNSLLHHLPDPSPLWKQVCRLAGRGAVAMIRDLARPPSDVDAEQLVTRHAGGESPTLRDEFHRSLLAAFTVDEVKEQLRHAGLGHLQVAMTSDRHLDIWGTI